MYIKIIYFTLSKINPEGTIIIRFLRKFLQNLDFYFSDKIIYGLSNLIATKPLSKYKSKSIYFPFYIDYNFLSTLNSKDIKSGLGEMLHYCLVSSENDFILFLKYANSIIKNINKKIYISWSFNTK